MAHRRSLAELLDDDPITLAEASEIVLRGAVTVSTLRAEVRRGTLTVERIGKNLFTTRAYIREMRERCRITSPRAAAADTPSVADELAALKAIAQNLKQGRPIKPKKGPHDEVRDRS